MAAARQLCSVECDHRRLAGASKWIHSSSARSKPSAIAVIAASIPSHLLALAPSGMWTQAMDPGLGSEVGGSLYSLSCLLTLPPFLSLSLSPLSPSLFSCSTIDHSLSAKTPSRPGTESHLARPPRSQRARRTTLSPSLPSSPLSPPTCPLPSPWGVEPRPLGTVGGLFCPLQSPSLIRDIAMIWLGTPQPSPSPPPPTTPSPPTSPPPTPPPSPPTLHTHPTTLATLWMVISSQQLM